MDMTSFFIGFGLGILGPMVVVYFCWKLLTKYRHIHKVDDLIEELEHVSDDKGSLNDV